MGILIALSLFGCNRESESAASPPIHTAAGKSERAAAAGWYRAIIRAADGTEIWFFLGVPAAGKPGDAVFRVGTHDVKSEATFDGKTLAVPMAVHQTAVEAQVGADGALTGTFSTSWQAWGTSTLPLTATKIEAPAVSALGTVPAGGAPIDLGEARTVWKLATSDSGTAKLALEQTAPGDFAGLLSLDTGNLIYVAGNGRGDALVLTGFDGTSAYRVDLALAEDRKRAKGKLFGGHKLDWRETLTASRVPDFALAVKAKPAKPRARIGLPDRPELAALPPGPLLVELAGSWCSTCRNAAPFLVAMHREYAPRGLQMVTLLYEFTDDPEADAKQVEAFKRTYGVTWPVVAIPGDVDAFAEIMPSGLADLNPSGFPITLFLGADRSLHALHAGFPAPDAEGEFRRVTGEFRANIEALLGAPAVPRRQERPVR